MIVLGGLVAWPLVRTYPKPAVVVPEEQRLDFVVCGGLWYRDGDIHLDDGLLPGWHATLPFGRFELSQGWYTNGQIQLREHADSSPGRLTITITYNKN